MQKPKTSDWCFYLGVIVAVCSVFQGYVVATGEFASIRWIADFIFLCTSGLIGTILILTSAILDKTEKIEGLLKELGEK